MSLPRLESAESAILDVGPRTFKLKATIPDTAEFYLLSFELDLAVDAGLAQAKWKKKTRSLVITMPCSD